MKILYLSSSPTMCIADRRGYSTHIEEMIQAFEQTGNTVLPLLGGIHSQENINQSFSNKAKTFIPGRIFEAIRIFYDISFDLKYFSRAEKALQSFSPDFIYERYLPYHLSGIRVKKKYNIPLIIEVNAPLSERGKHYGERKRRLGHFIEKISLRSANAVVVVSNSLKNYLINSGIDGSKVCVIPNAADTKKFHPDVNGTEIKKKFGIDDKLVVGFVGGFSNWHGIDSLLEAARDVIKSIKNIHFLLVGEGPMKGFCEKFVQDNNLTKFVTFAGSVSYEKIPQYIAAMDITTMPCSNTYGSPIKIFEYMAMEKPVIAPKVGPVEEIIENGKDGLLIEPGNKDQLQNSILYLSDNQEIRNSLAKNARQKLIKNHTWQKNAERIVQLL